MWARAKYILLPICGALAAILAFHFAAPFEPSLAHPGMDSLDPATRFTFNTKWGEVNRLVFGSLLCSSFCLILTLGRQAWWKVLRATILGFLLGAAANNGTDSGADLIGLALAKVNPMLGELVGSVAWCILVPAGISLSIVFAIGPTKERLRRAVFSTFFASFTSFAAQNAVGMMAGPDLMKQALEGGLTPQGVPHLLLQAQVPIWRSEAIAVGIALGLTMVLADQWSRAGTIRLLLGTHEFRDWSLDHPVSRVGSSEGSEIPVWGFHQVQTQHAQIVRSGYNFVLEAFAQPSLVNGYPVQSAVLVHGDTILLGDATFIFLARGRPRQNMMPRYETRAIPMQPVVLAAHVLVDAGGGHFTLAPGSYEVGRDASNAICLSHETSVSRRHGAITVTPQGAQVVDLGSSNGTRVNGHPIYAPTKLNPGDTIEFGVAMLLYSQQ